jgi:cell division cycle protein 20 (cofactor of APC complex)
VPQLDRLPRAQSLLDDEFESVTASHYAHPLTRSASFAGFTRASRTGPSAGSSLHGPIPHHGMALMRSVSAASFSSSSEITPVYSEISAKHYLRSSKVSIDFSVSATGPDVGALPLSWSTQNMLLFSRGNRVHYKNMSSGEEIGQLCKLRASWGDLRLIECGGTDQSNVAAIGTSKGYVQIWDLTSKKITANWTTKGVTSMCWNGPVLTVGGLKGTIRHYDTRTKETPKMKEQAKKVTRHQAKITRLAWNVDGNYLASGDESGTIYCWDSRQKVPLDVGEFVQRRKKMQHPGVITASPASIRIRREILRGSGVLGIDVVPLATTTARLRRFYSRGQGHGTTMEREPVLCALQRHRSREA